jgi:predicted aspartyl protease
LSKIIGSVDHLCRPVVRVALSGGESFLALVDTGFNGELMIGEQDAIAFGFSVTLKFTKARLADDVVQDFREASGTLIWMGSKRRVEILVNRETDARRSDGDPIAIIGTRLLTPHLLLIDFEAATVEIEMQD